MSAVGMRHGLLLSGSVLLLTACNSDSVSSCSDRVQVMLAPADTMLPLDSSFVASARL